jgi:hypothetical protein
MLEIRAGGPGLRREEGKTNARNKSRRAQTKERRRKD